MGSNSHTAATHLHQYPGHLPVEHESKPHVLQRQKREEATGDPEMSPICSRSYSLNSQESADSLSNLKSYSRQDTGYSSSGQSDTPGATTKEPPELLVPLNINRKENDEFLKVLARLIPNWQLLAIKLKFNDEDIRELEMTYGMREEQCYQMLKRWAAGLHEEATFSVLHSQMRSMNRDDLQVLILEHVQSLTIPPSTQTPQRADLTIVVDDAGKYTPIDDIPLLVKPVLQRHGYTHATVTVVGHTNS